MRARTEIAVGVAGLAALVQGLVLWLILDQVRTMFDSFVLAFSALALAAAGEAMREASASPVSARVGLVFALVVVEFGVVSACIGKASMAGASDAWNVAAFVAALVAAVTAWGTRNFVEEAA